MDDDLSDDPYEMTEAAPKCPQCAADVLDISAYCLACGHRLTPLPDAGPKPLKRSWDASPPLRTRLWFFAIYEAGLLLLGSVLVLAEAWTLTEFVTIAAFVSLLAVYVVGTFDRVDLTRNYHGKVALSRTWRFCFIPLGRTRIRLRDYEALATSAHTDHGYLDWVILIWLLTAGLLPGILWWIFVFSKTSHQVALTRDHGFPALVLYQGVDEAHMNDIAETVSSVCKKRLRRSH